MSRSGCRRCSYAPDWRKELDEDISVEGKCSSMGLVSLVGLVGEELHDGQREVIRRRKKIRYDGSLSITVREMFWMVLTKEDLAVWDRRSTRNSIGKEILKGLPGVFSVSEVGLDIKVN